MKSLSSGPRTDVELVLAPSGLVFFGYVSESEPRGPQLSSGLISGFETLFKRV